MVIRMMAGADQRVHEAAATSCTCSAPLQASRRSGYHRAVACASVRSLAGVALPLRACGRVAAASARRAAPRARGRDAPAARSSSTQGKIGRKKGTERVLTTEISALQRAHRPPAGAHRARCSAARHALQADLDAKRAELAQHPGATCAPSARASSRLRARLAEARTALAAAAASSSTRPTSPTSSP